jgi:predicted nucleotidyltransferase
MVDNYNPEETDATYQNQDTSSNVKIDDIEILKKKAAEQAAKIEEQKKEFAKKIKDLMDDTLKKAIPFKKEAVGKFKERIVGMLIMPPKADKKLETKTGKINENLDILCLLELKDITDIKKKIEKKQEIEKKIKELGKKKLPGHDINVVMLAEVWDMCLKGKHDILNLLVMGQPLYDNGWLGAIRMTEIHKMKVLRKFEKYVICYVLAGSMVRGDADETSDVDTYIVIDDTDVTRMTSAELKARLQGIIIGYSQEAAMAAGVDNKLNVQVYILSDMWDSIKNANPVIVTFLRDGIPLYDRGMFSPWKQLLRSGKIKPTPEAITNYMKAGDQIVKRIEAKLKDIAVEDFFWATSTPTQGALMLLGFQPPTPKEISGDMREHLVKTNLIEEKYVKTWDKIFKLRKDIEHGTIKNVDGKTVATLLDDTKAYLKRMDKLFQEVEKSKVCEEMENLYSKTIEDCLAAVTMMGVAATKSNVLKKFKDNIVDKQLASERYHKLIIRIEELSKSCKATREEIASISFEQDKLARDVFNLIRAEHGQKIEKFKVSAQYNNGKDTAAIWLFTDDAYIILDVNKADTEITHYKISSDGALTDEKRAKLSDIEKKLQTFSGTPTIMTKKTIDSIKNILSDDVKIVIGA